MKIVIDIPEEVRENFIKRGMDKGVIAQAIKEGTPLSENEFICKNVKMTTADGEKFTAMLDKSRMLLWRHWVTVEFAKEALGWKFTETEEEE